MVADTELKSTKRSKSEPKLWRCQAPVAFGAITSHVHDVCHDSFGAFSSLPASSSASGQRSRIPAACTTPRSGPSPSFASLKSLSMSLFLPASQAFNCTVLKAHSYHMI